MKYCTNCGEQLNEKQDICLSCGVLIKRVNEDDGSIGWFFLGLFMPVIGIVLYALWYIEKPKTAKYTLRGVITSAAIVMLLFIIVLLIPLLYYGF